MALRKLTLTEDHIKLIKNMKIDIDDDFGTIGTDYENPYGESDSKYDDIALILGHYNNGDRVVDGNKISYKEEVLKKFEELDTYIIKNFSVIVDLMFYMVSQPLTEGTYQTKSYLREWKKI